MRFKRAREALDRAHPFEPTDGDVANARGGAAVGR